MTDTKAFLTEAKTALVIIDLQRGIASRETAPHSATHVVGNAAKLVHAFRSAQLPIVFVRVSFGASGADALKPIVDEAMQFPPPAAGWDELVPELGAQSGDVIVTKRNWGAFYGTDLDLQLRRRGVQRIAICGIATHIGVESTARDAYERAYPLLFIEDAMAAMSAEEHAHALRYIFPRMGIIRSTSDVLSSLQ